MSKPIYFVILTAIPDRGDPFLLECDGGPGGKTNWAFHVIRVQIRDQNEANQVADVFRRAAVLCGAPSQPVGTAVTEPAQEQLTAEEIQNIVTKSTAGQFASPLAEKTLSEFLVAESNKTGVPTWLVLAQAKRETSFGSPQNGTVQDGRTFEDGTKGNAHNLFNIRPGSSWTGKKLDLGPGSGEFRVYDSYQDSVRDYMRLMSSSLYKGLTLHGLVYKYFPPSDNGGSAATERYIDTIINFAASQGVTITRDTVVVPAAPSDEKNACINNLRQIDAAKHQWALEGKGTASDTPTEREIASYLKEGIPKCPAGGVYTFLNAVDSVPTCSVAGHALPQ
jgi:flagellum-specific peptidoglycan hydrolase FlgJ